ncbi:MAG: hypothetical protein AAF447_13470 [Myxococcota bacterium]
MAASLLAAEGARDVGPAREETDAELGERLERFFDATRGPAFESRRPPPRLRSRRDGSLVWEGPTVGARIAADGSVTFSDLPSVRYTGGLSLGFDLSAWADRRAGNDPYYAERRWFLEQTEELRVARSREARAADQRRALFRFRGDLLRLWEDPARDAAAKRRALFERWRECAEDEAGQEARQAVLDFIRARLPAESPESYTAAELAQLRSERGGRSFRPYASP